METIQNISSALFKLPSCSWSTYEGYQIITDKQTIKLGITDQQNCCESWGFFMTNDNLQDFIGATLLDVKLVDDCLNVSKLNEVSGYEPCTMFVNIETDRGTLQFTAYNSHNGYYGHPAVVVSEQLTYDTCL